MNFKVSWGIMGMGVMGKNLSRNFANNGISLALYNRHVKGIEEHVAFKLTQKYQELNSALYFESIDCFVAAIKRPRKILIMLPSGPILYEIINELIPLLSENDIIIDGGNSHFEDTGKRAIYLAKKKIRFLGVGISGGESGALIGPSLMVGGDPDAYELVANDLEKIAAKDIKGKSCCNYFGTGGVGHYIKMIHNGIEYVEMQLIAEVFEIYLSNSDFDIHDIYDLFKRWQESSSESYLLGISAEILSYKLGEQPFINYILDKSSNKGTGAWATANGALIGSTNSLMSAALNARFTSSFKSTRKKLSGKYKNFTSDNNMPVPNLKKTYDICRWINHHQGFEMIRQAGHYYGWDIDLSKVAGVWSEGCIIKSRLIDQLKLIFKDNGSIMEIEAFEKLAAEGQKEWRDVLSYSVKKGIPIPCITNAWSYFLAITQA